VSVTSCIEAFERRNRFSDAYSGFYQQVSTKKQISKQQINLKVQIQKTKTLNFKNSDIGNYLFLLVDLCYFNFSRKDALSTDTFI
jgi:hypothetical protein